MKMERNISLDPENWDLLRSQAHKMVDDMFDHLISLRKQPVWKQMSEECIQSFEVPNPTASTPLESVYEIFQKQIVPYNAGNCSRYRSFNALYLICHFTNIVLTICVHRELAPRILWLGTRWGKSCGHACRISYRCSEYELWWA